MLRVVERYYSESAKLLMLVKAECYESANNCFPLVSKHSAGPTTKILFLYVQSHGANFSFFIFSEGVDDVKHRFVVVYAT